AILNGDLDKVDYDEHPIFCLNMPKYCPNVPTEILDPMNTWLQKGGYIRSAIQLAHYFHINFEKFESLASEDIMEGGPLIDEHHHLDHMEFMVS
ncbi:MAG: phosphoenolpyruvate carboxykinase (ATP), partial [Flavobacteriaceae bacterium]|nr:phosphoenolpyruvate carboxykinase (ATP) [Flavobacteriaceae bacterium]